jgi:hypothetical protein
MTDEETPVEGDSQEPVAQASAAPEEPAPAPEYVSKADLEAFGTALVDEIVPRLKQSQKDVIQDRVSSEVKEAMSSFDEAVEMLSPELKEGADIAALRREAFLNNLMAQSTSPEPEPEPEAPPQAAAPEPASLPPGREAEIAQILEQHEGLSGTEPELMEYAKANKDKPWWQVGGGFNDLAASIAARNTGTPAGVVAPQGQASNPDLKAEFRKELDDAMHPKDAEGNRVGPGRYGMNVLRPIQDKYRELGLSEEDLDISNKDGVATRGYVYRSESPYSQK